MPRLHTSLRSRDAASSCNTPHPSLLVVRSSGPAFARLTAEQQAVASEKVKRLRPHFEVELTSLKEERGWGALVTGEDIKEILPRVMARAAQASA